jgi:ABC-2 type transport system permease protein
MIPAIKSELRKMLTVRSTYIYLGVALAIVALFAGFIEGFRSAPDALRNPHLLSGESTSAIVFVGLLLAFVGLLLVGHEYRYNTIMYTLTAQNRRYKVLLAKLVVISMFAVVSSLIVTFFSPLCTIIGAALHGHHIGPQVFDYWSVIWHCVFCGWGYAMYGFVLAVLLRNQVGAIVTFLMFPLIGENLLTLLLKHAAKYLPFTALQAVVLGVEQPSGIGGNHTSILQATTTTLVYVVIGLIVGSMLFIKRDAN